MAILEILIDLFVILSPNIGYISQINLIWKEKSIGNFSLDVCAILIFANILRICFWFGERFAYSLLFQSIIMICTQIYLLKVCIKYRTYQSLTEKEVSLSDLMEMKNFWRWKYFFTYIESIGIFTMFALLITYLFLNHNYIIQFVGLSSNLIEACLPVPQFLSNYIKKDTKGISYGLIASWFLGDVFKTYYFISKDQPFQFILCGICQLIVDSSIIVQMLIYKERKD